MSIKSKCLKIILLLQVSEKLKLGAKTAIDIEKLRDGYRPAAKRGAILFFVLAEMSLVNTMYQYSLASYLDVFSYSLKKSMPDSILQKRLRNIMDTLTHNVYNYGCTGRHLVFCYLSECLQNLYTGRHMVFCYLSEFFRISILVCTI